MRSVLVVLLTLSCGGLPVDPHTTLCLSGFDDEHASIVIDAVYEWRDGTNGAINPPIVMGACEDGTQVIGVPNLYSEDGEKVGGRTAWDGSKIRLDTNYDNDFFKVAALHEFGHLFTECQTNCADGDHSNNPVDVMYFQENEQQSKTLTKNDLARFVP